MKKILTTIMLGAAMALVPVAANAQGHGGGRGGGGGFHGGGFHGGGFGGGGFHSPGSWGGVYHGGGYRGGGYRGGWGGGWGYPGYWWGWPYYYGAGLGLYLGYYDDPWFWGYPGYNYFGYPVYPYPSDTPPDYGNGYAPGPNSYNGAYNGAPPAAAAQQAPTCGNWQWNPNDRQYHWMTNGCQ